MATYVPWRGLVESNLKTREGKSLVDVRYQFIVGLTSESRVAPARAVSVSVRLS